jgi:hypothetical protein
MSLRPLHAHLKHKLLTDLSGAMREATVKARQLDPSAFACKVDGSPKHERCQIRLEIETVAADGAIHVVTALVGSGPTWAEALEMFWQYHQEQRRLVQ